MNQAGIYAGTFDPITLGHLDVIERAARVFPRLVVAVARNTTKTTLFTADERAELIRKSIGPFPNVEVEVFGGLLVEYARRKGIHCVIRGLRAFSDFEFEFQMALTNRKLAEDIETLFLMPKEDYSFISSGTVREIASLGGNVEEFAPPASCEALRQKLHPPADRGTP
ncbi:MAG: pantetheine-phosphate adenylyltransferase [Kiritimatiellia bacterium]|nr:pantetheine-phosphate adenylyltransferase [Kiritimatiellia bacterium]